MRSEIFDRILKNIPLETRLKVAIQSYFIKEYNGTFFMPLDENGDELPEAMESNRICFEKAQPLIDIIMDEIEEWKSDGKPE